MDVQIEVGERNVCLIRWTKGAVEALHEGTEAYMTVLMEDANLLALHAERITVQPRDIQLACCIRGGELGCEGLQFVGGNKFCKGFCQGGLFHL